MAAWRRRKTGGIVAADGENGIGAGSYGVRISVK